MRFEDVVAQEHVAATLRNAIATNRLAHAYIFSGPRGVGKTSTARILAKAINCPNVKESEPCNECEICKEITDTRSMDVLEIDGASNRGVDEIRNLRESVRYAPSKGKYRVYIIDEVHMLTKEAFNALLKTLEEPPSHILFIFATTEPHKVPPTILSRCQRFDFHRIAIDNIITNLRQIAQEEQITIDDDSLMIVAKKGDGSLRDAQSIFDQVVSFCGNIISSDLVLNALNIVDIELFFRVTDLVKEKNTKGGLDLVEEIVRRGYDIQEFLIGLLEHLRNLLVAITMNSTHLIEAAEVHRKWYQENAKDFTESDVLRLVKLVSDAANTVKYSQQPRLKLEMTIVQMVRLDTTVQIETLLQRIEDLKKNFSRGDTCTAPTVPAIPVPESKPIQTEQTIPPNTTREIDTPVASEPAIDYRVSLPHEFGKPLSSFPLNSQESTTQDVQVPPTLNQSSVPTTSLEEVRARWEEFVAEVRRQKIAVGTVLSQCKPLSLQDGILKLGCIDDFQVTSVKRNREFIMELLQRTFNAKLKIESSVCSEDSTTPIAPLTAKSEIVELSPAESPSRLNNANHTSHGKPVEPSPSASTHPIIQAMMRELGAEPLE